MTTATLERKSLADFLGADKYEVSRDVAILDEHVRSDGSKLDKHALESICERLNDWIDDSEDYRPIHIRHTPDDDALPQPAVIGYAGPFEVKKFGAKKPRWAIFAKEWAIERGAVGEAAKHPRRSVELALDRETGFPSHINSIALLGAEAPRRMLGLKFSDKDGHDVERYAMPMGGDEKSSGGKQRSQQPGQQNGNQPRQQQQQQSPFSALAGDDALVAKMLAAIEQTDVFTWARQQMAVQATKDSQNPDDAGGDDSGGEFAGADDEIDDDQIDDDQIDDDNQAGGFPAGKKEKSKMSEGKKNADGNTDKMAAHGEVEKYKAEVGELRGMVDKLSAKNEELSGVVASLQKDKIKAERIDKLRDLAEKGLAFDLADARSEVDKMESQGEFDRYVAMLEKHCTRVPIDHELPGAKVDKLKSMNDTDKAEKVAKRAEEIVEEMRSTNPKQEPIARYKSALAKAEREFATAD